MTTPSGQASQPASRSRRRTGVVLAAISTLLCLLAVEIGFRIVRRRQAPITLEQLEARREYYRGRPVSPGHMIMASENPRLVYELIPGLDVFWHGCSVRTNSDGFRDDEFSRQKTSGTIRIAAIGDSTAFGWKVRKADCFPDIVEQILNRFRKDARFDVMNFGVFGYNSAMERELLVAKALPLDPDMVWLQFDGNDIDLPNFLKKRENVWRLDRLYLWDFLRSQRFRGSNKPPEQAPELAGVETVPMKEDELGRTRVLMDEDRIPPELRDMVGKENCKAAIRDIGRICREKAIPAVFVLNPNVVDHLSEEQPAAEHPVYVPFVEAARQSGFIIADPTVPMVKFLRRRGLISRDLWVDPSIEDAHPTPPRHSLVALGIVQAMLENNLLPPDAIDRTRIADLLAAFEIHAEEQWVKLARPSAPKVLEENMIQVIPGPPDVEAAALAEGWYAHEIGRDGEAFRWCKPRATLRLPAAQRMIVEVGTEWPRYLGPPDHAFLVNGRPLRYRLTRRNGKAWFDIPLPEDAVRDPDTSLTVQIRCKPVDIPFVPKDQRREWGLLVHRILIERPRDAP